MQGTSVFPVPDFVRVEVPFGTFESLGFGVFCSRFSEDFLVTPVKVKRLFL